VLRSPEIDYCVLTNFSENVFLKQILEMINSTTSVLANGCPVMVMKDLKVLILKIKKKIVGLRI
jgi:hypothetical protein